MTAIASAVYRTTGIWLDVETFRIVMFCGLGLVASLLLASYGLDLSPEFF